MLIQLLSPSRRLFGAATLVCTTLPYAVSAQSVTLSGIQGGPVELITETLSASATSGM